MNTIRIPKIQASAPPSDCGDPVSAKDRAAFAVNVTGFALAIGCSHAGIVATGTKTELAKTIGNTTTNPAACTASTPRTLSATKTNTQFSEKPNAATIATDAKAPAT